MTNDTYFPDDVRHPHGTVRNFLQTVRGSLLQVHPVPLILGVATSAWYLAPMVAALGDRTPPSVIVPSNRPSIVSPPPTNPDPVNKIEGEVPPTEPAPLPPAVAPPAPNPAGALPPAADGNRGAGGGAGTSGNRPSPRKTSLNHPPAGKSGPVQQARSRLPLAPPSPWYPPSSPPRIQLGQNQSRPYAGPTPMMQPRYPFGLLAFGRYFHRGPMMGRRYMGGFRGAGGRRR